MVAWGPLILESDEDNDIMTELNNAALKIISTDPKYNPSWGVTELASLPKYQKYWNEGVFTDLLDKLKVAGPDFRFYGKERYVVILFVTAMDFGANISDEQKEYAKSIMNSAGLSKEGVAQFQEGLEKYVNGQSYEWSTPETRARFPEDLGLEHDFSRVYEDEFPTLYDLDSRLGRKSRELRCGGCNRPQSFLEPGQTFKRCAKCTKACYCNKDCQKKAWSRHKTICDRLADEGNAQRYDEAFRALLTVMHGAGAL